jgi:methanogenic corrinoid protein MtbC1
LVSASLERIGERWERGEVSLAQVYLTAKMCQDLIRPWTPPESTQPAGSWALVVLEDQHVLGASLVRSVLGCAGFAPAYWGTLDTSTATARLLAEKPSVLLVSTLMLRSALNVSKLTKAIRDAGLSTRVIVGGAPFRFDGVLWQEVGAAAMGRTAADALAFVRAAARGAE